VCVRVCVGLQEVVTDISVPSSQCLVLLSGINCPLVVDECLSLTTPSQLPHYYIVKTLADVAANQPVPFVQKLKEVMARLTPVMGNIKKSPMKWVFATGATTRTHMDTFRPEARGDAWDRLVEQAFLQTFSPLTDWSIVTLRFSFALVPLSLRSLQ